MCDAIESFVREAREAGRAKGLMTEAHLDVLRCVLLNARRHADDDPAAYGAMWAYALAAITKSEWPVKRRLQELDTIADVFGAAYSRRLPPFSEAIH